MKIKKVFIGLALFTLLFNVVSAQDISTAWEQFSSNKLKDAEATFKKCLSDTKTKPEALIGLSLISWHNDNEKKPFEYIQEFTTSISDPYPYLYALWSTPCVNNSTRLEKRILRFIRK